MKRLVLFDIDGTILNGGRLWRECFDDALSHCYPNIDFPRVSFSGKTDHQICRELLTGVGLDTDRMEEASHRIIHQYLDRLSRTLPHRAREVTILPGIPTLLASLAGLPNIQMGLLTGNVREGARLKLSAVGLYGYFKTGAFGDDHWNRYELPQIAIERARSELGITYREKEVVVIGDTVHDVNCGKSLNVRTIAVATGRPEHRKEILTACPDYFFETLENTRQVIQAINEALS